jgi:hypothetical protein
MAYIEHGRLAPPPERIYRAYLYLVYQVFLIMRSSAYMGEDQARFLEDLGDAMHNVVDLISHYEGGRVDDDKFRHLYLRPFDAHWGKHPGSPPNLEQILDNFLEDFDRRAEAPTEAANDGQ